MPNLDANDVGSMMLEMSAAHSVPANLLRLAETLQKSSLRELFESDSERATALCRSLHLNDTELLVDFSKQRITVDILRELIDFARTAGVLDLRDRMIAGEHINSTEDRPVSHVAVRATSQHTAAGELLSEATRLRGELREYVESVPDSLTHVVNIGIGGSDLGPALLCDALAAMRPPRRSVRFASNIDPLDLDRALAGIDPHHTMFVVCSKSFTTVETLANAKRAAAWLVAGGVVDPASHMVAVTSRPDRVADTKLPIGRILTMPVGVGGRFSVSSSVSVAVALSYGADTFASVCDGMRLVDEHFVSASPNDNLPLIIGLIWWWNAAVMRFPSVAVVPYSRALTLLPSYLQQLLMESNGKSVDRNGNAVELSSPIVWGATGTNAQHAFFQLLHQGTHEVPCDFIGHSAALGSSSRDHDTLVANMFAQSQALAFGVRANDIVGDAHLRPHRATPGNRPSTTLLFSSLTPRALGALIAIYEHATVVQGALFGVNSFDQWGVELGKALAVQVAQDINGTPSAATDASTAQLVDHHRRWRNGR
jgi:glucose-6-phosphate isomerase